MRNSWKSETVVLVRDVHREDILRLHFLRSEEGLKVEEEEKCRLRGVLGVFVFSSSERLMQTVTCSPRQQ